MTGNALVEIVILALVAGFVALRFVSVLGKRTGHEQTIGQPADGAAARAPGLPRSPDAAPAAGAIGLAGADIEPAAADGLRAIVAADPEFDVARFLDGAQAAYRMVLEAFWEGDRDTLKSLVDTEVFDDFVAAIDARTEAGHVLENKLVRIERARVVSASLNSLTAQVSIQFDADIAALTRDSEGRIVAGSSDDAVETHDIWTFARHVRAEDPNWLLIATDDA
jgi:predicted lipid-binding transport protein (Tim44 family)